MLIIDEVSMIDAALFEKLNAIAQFVRGSDLPFGGIQLIACGDFFQLPPVLPQVALRKCGAFTVDVIF